MLTTNQKGAAAGTAIAHEAIKLGIEVYRPVAEGGRFDLIFAFGDASLARVQCKWAPVMRGVVPIRAYSARRAADGLRSRCYTADEIDAIAAYCPDTGHCYDVPVEELDGQRTFHLRLGPAANNQAHGVDWAVEYELGAIAQLGERVTGSHEVAGSSPASSIVRRPP
jgi:PD-(D/E)XK endonuclease